MTSQSRTSHSPERVVAGHGSAPTPCSALVRGFDIEGELAKCERCGYSPIQESFENVNGKWFRFLCPECGPNWRGYRGMSKELPHWWLSKQEAADHWNELNTPNEKGEPCRD